MIEVTEDEPEPVAAQAITTAQPAIAAAAVAEPALGTDINRDAAPIVIIGSGYAGYGLAEALRKRDAQVPVVLFTLDDGANYSKPGLSNAMARGKTPPQLVTASAEDMAQRLNITVHTDCRVQQIEPEQHRLVSEQGELTYSKLVLATGAEPLLLPLSGDAADEVVSVNSLSDYRHFRARLDALQPASGQARISIIGNGLVGSEYANELINQGYAVNVIGLSRWPLDPMMPEALGRRLQQRLQDLGVNWYLETTVQSVEHDGAGYRLTLGKGETLAADLVLSAIGLRPRIELAEKAGITCQRGICIDEYLRTSAEDVYALGDCTEINGQVLPYIAPITHGLRALADTLLDQPTAVHYPLMPVVVKTPALPLLLEPPKPGLAGEWQVSSSEQGLRGLFVDEQQRVAGFALSDELTHSERQQWLEAISNAQVAPLA
ncbi:MAG: FAD-dependent oxidoreductase [Thiolinea sp.]